MVTILLVGFELFDKYLYNPSEELVLHFNSKRVGGHEIVGIVLPVELHTVTQRLQRALKEVMPAATLGLGLHPLATELRGGRLRDLAASAALLLAAVGFAAASFAADLYMLCSGPKPTPTTSPWMPWIEVGLVVMSLGVVTAYMVVLYDTVRTIRNRRA